MPVHRATNGNEVIDWEHTPDDTHFRLHIHGLDQHYASPLFSIEQHAEVLSWALELAGQMTRPIHLVPYSRVEALKTPDLQLAAISLDEDEREELRIFVIAQLAQIMRDSPLLGTRTEAHDLLVTITGAGE